MDLQRLFVLISKSRIS